MYNELLNTIKTADSNLSEIIYDSPVNINDDNWLHKAKEAANDNYLKAQPVMVGLRNLITNHTSYINQDDISLIITSISSTKYVKRYLKIPINELILLEKESIQEDLRVIIYFGIIDSIVNDSRDAAVYFKDVETLLKKRKISFTPETENILFAFTNNSLIMENTITSVILKRLIAYSKVNKISN